MPVIVLILLASLMPAAVRTLKWASDAHGLSILATMDEDSYSLNPYSRDGYLIPQNAALWILENFDFPYGECTSRITSKECMPLINFVGAGLGSGSQVSKKRGFQILHHLIERGANVDSRTNLGYTALHESVLYCDIEYMKFLVSAGADVTAKIELSMDFELKKYNGLNAEEFLMYLQENAKKYDCREASKILRSEEA